MIILSADVIRQVIESFVPRGGGSKDHQARRTLLALATVNRMFSDIALDYLWDCATPWRLAMLMPPSLIRIEITSTNNASHGTFTPDEYRQKLANMSERVGSSVCYSNLIQLAVPIVSVEDVGALLSGRFLFYSQRVKRLSRSIHTTSRQLLHRDSSETVDAAVICMWQIAQATLFPELRTLVLQLPGSEDSALCRLLTISITHLSLSANTALEEQVVEHWLDDIARPGAGLDSLIIDLADTRHSYALVSTLVNHAERLRILICSSIPFKYSSLNHFASHPALRQLTVGRILADQPLILSCACFPVLESLTVRDEGRGAEFIQGFLAHAPPHHLRKVDLHLSYKCSLSLADWLTILYSMSSFVHMTHIYLKLHVPVTEESRCRMIPEVLMALSPMVSLESLEIYSSTAMVYPSFISQETILPQWSSIHTLVFLSHQPAEIDLPGFLKVLLAFPCLTRFGGVINCSQLPSMDDIAPLAQLRHPYNNLFYACSITRIAELVAVLHTALPKQRPSAFVYLNDNGEEVEDSEDSEDQDSVTAHVIEHWNRLRRDTHIDA